MEFCVTFNLWQMPFFNEKLISVHLNVYTVEKTVIKRNLHSILCNKLTILAN